MDVAQETAGRITASWADLTSSASIKMWGTEQKKPQGSGGLKKACAILRPVPLTHYIHRHLFSSLHLPLTSPT